MTALLVARAQQTKRAAMGEQQHRAGNVCKHAVGWHLPRHQHAQRGRRNNASPDRSPRSFKGGPCPSNPKMPYHMHTHHSQEDTIGEGQVLAALGKDRQNAAKQRMLEVTSAPEA